VKRAAVQRITNTWAITVTGTGDPALALRWLHGAADAMEDAGSLSVTSVVPVQSAAAGPRVVRRPVQ